MKTFMWNFKGEIHRLMDTFMTPLKFKVVS